jgi:nicotinate-nucleotide adenylyltransferase
MIGIFGGTFDPPHLGHLILAEQALQELSLEEVWWLLTPRSPLKPDAEPAAADVRARMVRAAIEPNPRFRLTTIDIDRSPPYYTVETLARIRADSPRTPLSLLIGGDALAELPRWREPRRIVELCDVIGVMNRTEQRPDLAQLDQQIPGLAAKVRAFRIPRMEISARDIRQRVSERRSIRYLVPDAVRDIIEKEALYRK